MCGIAGYVGTRRPADSALTACVAALQQRGPDDQGVKRFEFARDI